jgi:hypothetical protein
LPDPCRDGRLGPFARDKIAAQRYALDAFRLCDFQRKRRARIPMPDFDRVDAMPTRALAPREKKINSSSVKNAIFRPI